MSTIVKLFRGQHRSRDRFVQLLRPHVEIMYRMAFQWTQDQQLAEDLVQEVLTRLATRLDELEAVDKLRPWLLKVLYRQFVDEYRRKSRRPETLESELPDFCAAGDDENVHPAIPDVDADNLNPAYRFELEDQLKRALKELDPEQRVVLLMHDANGYTDSEIAIILAISRGTVKSRLHRARKKIKNFIAREPIAIRQRVSG